MLGGDLPLALGRLVRGDDLDGGADHLRGDAAGGHFFAAVHADGLADAASAAARFFPPAHAAAGATT